MLYVHLIPVLFITATFAKEDKILVSNSTSQNLKYEENTDEDFSSSTVSESVQDSIGMPDYHPKHPHQTKSKDSAAHLQPHRRPVYEVVNQPCYPAGCSGYGHNGPWRQQSNRFVPYNKYPYGTRHRGRYPPVEIYPGNDYMRPSYDPRFGDYRYVPRMPPYQRDRYGSYGVYGQPPYGFDYI
ncbi:uncharacterized protein LOC118202207 [Stegodyphus dumicola]|uniref:uncharacterized protein LOC118202207 n=1 Tax=Stegodyphus dumicola TaxID=202533 RepID=UPI0015A93A93|nr:uncharacterized protein LOC118202207 [Stegodyphus dumicola]